MSMMSAVDKAKDRQISGLSSQTSWRLGLLYLLASLAVAIAGLVLVFLAQEALPFMVRVGPTRFFTDPIWSPSTGFYNLVPMLVGTLLSAVGALLLATPVGIMAAVFLFFFAPSWLASPFRRMLELLAGIPSVIYGFWGLVVLVPLINAWRPPGASLLASILVLAIMILPTVALVADASFAAVPANHISGARALGLGPWGCLRMAIFPNAKAALGTGILLQTGRALGETMAVLMVCGNIVQIPGSVFAPVRTLTTNIALEMAYAMNEHRAALFVSGLLLMVVVIVLAFSAAGGRYQDGPH